LTSAVTGSKSFATTNPLPLMPKTQDQLYTRPPLDRMMQIHEQIKAGKYPNCVKMARELEVSKRTIIRDMDFMRDRLRLPIEFDWARNGFFYSRPVNQFPTIAITESEMFALLVAHKAIAQYHGTPFQRPLEAAFRKLTGSLDSSTQFTLGDLDKGFSFRPFAPDDTDLQVFEVLSQGLRENRLVRFSYKNLGASTFKPRTVAPCHMACIDNRWYLFAHDYDKKALRCFVLARMKGPGLTARKFTKPRKFDPNEYLKNTFVAFTGPDDYQVVVEFDSWATDLVRGRKWHSTQEFIELPSGCSRLTMRLNSIEEMERFVLGWGTHVTAIKPDALVERIRKVALEIAQKYSPA
jgi:predicted DNA-binding transcriptional regulator YafY